MNQRGALIDLAKRINDGFNAVDSKRVEVGRLLLQAREIIDAERASHGGPTWERWCVKNVERSQPDIRKVMAMARSANSKATQERERAGARERMRRLRHEHASEADDRANVRALRDEGMYVKLPPEVRAHYGHIDFDPCPAFPEPGFDGLEVEWPDGTVLVHPPYVARHELKGRGTKAWVVKALAHHKKGNRVIVILSVHEPIYMLLEAGAKIVPEGRVRCLHKITDKPDPHPPVTVGFVLEPKQESTLAAAANDDGRIDPLAKVSPELPPKLNLSDEKKITARSLVERAMHPGNTVADLLSYVRAYHRVTGGWMPSELDIGSFAVQIDQLKADKAAALADSAKAIKLEMENRQLKTRIRQLEFELASLKSPRRKER